MIVAVVLGSQWGDEGKGKLVDILCSTATLCCRAQGGHNAGHTIVHDNETKFDVHILPSGVVSENCVNLIGNGCVVHVPTFFDEYKKVHEKVNLDNRIFISDRAHLILKLHTVVDGLQEAERGKASVGTTGKGIGPAYSTKATRSGIRMLDIFNKPSFDAKVRALADGFVKRYGVLPNYDVEDEIAYFDSIRETLRPFIKDQVTLLKRYKENKNATVLVEGANALMLDVDAGTYPFVTSSNASLGGVLTSLSIGWRSIKEVYGVVKAYTTRVGSGPFPTEQLNDIGEKLQQIGGEIGVTTGRKRRCGWLDLPLLKYSHQQNDYTHLNFTKMDVLDTFPEIKVGVAYKLDGVEVESFPADADAVDRVEVVYKTFPGWMTSTQGVQEYSKLPENAKRYVEFVEKELGIPICYIGTGPGRRSMILRN